MKWSEASKVATANTGGGLFIKIGDGDSLRIVPLLEEHILERLTHWTGTKTEDCAHPAPCALCDEYRRDQKWLAQVYDLDEGSVRIWDMSNALLRELTDELNEVNKNERFPILKVSRQGLGKNTRYKVRLKGAVDDDDQIAHIEDSNRHDLTQYGGRPPQDDDMPF